MAIKFSNADIVEQVIMGVLDISRRKASEGEAISTMNSLLTGLQQRYEFIEGITIHDARYTEEDRSVSVLTSINEIPSSEVANALYTIITQMHQSLGRRAGHFFMKELRKRIGSDYFSTMQDLGVDLSVMQLENEVLK